MVFNPGDVYNLKMDISIHFSEEIEVDLDDLKLFVDKCIRLYFVEPDLIKFICK